MNTNNDRPVLVCLHGWGGSKESFTELRAVLKGEPIEILTPDLPGFGKEPEPKKPWTTDDYANWVEEWIKEQMENGKWKMENGIHLLGHSHGGRIALKLAYRQSLKQFSNFNFQFSICHLYLCAAAGIRHPRHIRRIIGLTLAKSGKFFLKLPVLKTFAPLGKKFLYKLVRVHDYEHASAVMRQTLINVSSEDLRPILKDIRIGADIFWGTNDRMTPLSDGHAMKREIRGSILHEYERVRHSVHREKANEIATVIHARMNLS